ncbi:LytTR family transcriptional regulator DNA-binding domain-containing protein [Spirosoma sp. SC4-14]|uniref:response regulator transcription factor n=1 Tax=Spirosoma sp. SC4-14 TaxID=3128900 RepID=UPI0030CD2C79
MSVIQSAIQNPLLIDYLSGANNYTWLCFRNGEKKLLAKPISYLETKLPSFVRIHKTALINPNSVKKLEHPPRKKMAGAVHLESGVVLPVSRRRWSQVVDALQPNTILSDIDGLASDLVKKVPVATTTPIAAQQRSINLVTDDQQCASELKKILEMQWPFTLHILQQAAYLPELLHQLPEPEQPAFILLDARTSAPERLKALERLKEDNQLCRIPVILLVGQSDKLVISGYRQGANSVIAMPARNPQFVDTVERVCKFWLKTASLPVQMN